MTWFSVLLAIFKSPLDIIYSIKWIIAYLAIRFYNACHSKRFDLYDVKAKRDPVKSGFIIPELEKELESPFTESHLKEAADEIIFYGVNSKSECLLVRITRGCNQVAEAWIYLKLADGKTYHLVETIGYQQPFEDKCVQFSCGKLQMYYLLPMRRWRIFYCGMLKETSVEKKDYEEMVFVKFVFLWNASSDVYDLTLDSNPEGFASALARSQWKIPFVPPLIKCSQALNFYAQTGAIMGTVTVNDGTDYEMNLFGEKLRSIGKSANIVGCTFTNLLGITPENGTSLHLTKASAPYLFNNLPFGFVRRPDGHLETVKELDLTIKPYNPRKSENSFYASFTAGEKDEISGKIIGEPIILYSGEGWSGYLEVCYIEFKLHNKKGTGLILSGEVYKEPKRQVKHIENISLPETVPLTVKFKEEISHFQEISGGKGSSLGKLTKLSSDLKTFQVPQGLIVTTAAYSEFITNEISKEIQNLENITYGNVVGDLKAACHQVGNAMVKTLLPTKICQGILKDLKDMYGNEVNRYKFAVRSSATGEDTASMSSAGQMETFLGVQGLKEIYMAVKKCWASQFGFIAIEYKRRNGQILNSPMAVVIQEMVASEVSGVLFTCDPVTNNPSFITITANYGLGETVVSGSVEPDTIILRRKGNEQVEIHSTTVGGKHQKIIMQDSGGTVTEDVSEDSRNESCLSKETAERLGRLAIKIEKYYKCSRDIEWGISNNSIYILQSRPITNAAGETEYEIKHEFDSPLRSEAEYITVANVGEVMPGATSPLGMELVLKLVNLTYQRSAEKKGKLNNIFNSNYFFAGMLSFCNHLMMTMVELITRYGIDTNLSKGMQISIFGRILDDPELMDFARERYSEPPSTGLLEQIQYYQDIFFHDSGAEKAKKEVDSYHFNFLKPKTSEETFAELLNACEDFYSYFDRHVTTSEASSEWNMHLLSVLCRAKGSFDTDVYSDFARLLATSLKVESADVPQAMQLVACQIAEDIDKDKFKTMPVEEAQKWLETSKSLAGQKFRIFMKRHGHRCLKEFDVHSVTWEMNPKPLVKSLQNLVGVPMSDKKEDCDSNKLLSELHVPLGFIHRCALKFILPNCHRAVRAREASKSMIIKCYDHWRKGFRYLAKLMVSEGRIPEENLIFFFTLDEIKELLQTRNPSIIARANYRRKLHPKLNEYKFPEIMRGIPKPINEEEETADNYVFEADLTMKGIPVSQGVVKGTVRVAISLEEASHLKPGEILITYSTDIGWSPYFPIMAGVVTELGGLISHGAVVSREYGLPCVVGLQGATKKFRTGDFVLLDGKKGILQRLTQPQP